MVRWHHRQWHEFEQGPGVGDGLGNLACCNSWGRRVHPAMLRGWRLVTGWSQKAALWCGHHRHPFDRFGNWGSESTGLCLRRPVRGGAALLWPPHPWPLQPFPQDAVGSCEVGIYISRDSPIGSSWADTPLFSQLMCVLKKFSFFKVKIEFSHAALSSCR